MLICGSLSFAITGPRLLSAMARSHSRGLAPNHDASSTYRLTPVMTPDLLASGPSLASPADLSRHTLLHEANHDGWALWFRASGLPDFALEPGLVYADAAHALKAAKLGHGIALGDRVMEGDDFRGGTLVRPFKLAVPYGAYWLVALDFQLLSRPAKDFAGWIVAELAVNEA